MRIFEVFSALLTLHFTLSLETKTCREIFNRKSSPKPGELEASTSMKLNTSELNTFKNWEIEITFTGPVNLTIKEVYVHGETVIRYHEKNKNTSTAEPITSFRTVGMLTSSDRQTYIIRKGWGNINVRTKWKVITFSVEMNIKFRGKSIDIARAKLNSNLMCKGEEICGASTGSHSLVRHEEVTSPGDWPWLAAIIVRTRSTLIFECGGSLVSPTRVITAAHCMKRSRSTPTRKPNDLLVYLGRHKLFNYEEEERETQVLKVSAIFVHPDWSKRGSSMKDGDIAVLVLNSPAEFSDYVRPVCISFSFDEIQPMPETEGKMIGWGLKENGEVSSEPHSVGMPVVTTHVCRETNLRSENLTTDRTFCAGKLEGINPCFGESGGGFYTTFKLPADTRRYSITGIVSRSLKKTGEHTLCDKDNYFVFTNLYSFRFWLRDITGVPIQWR